MKRVSKDEWANWREFPITQAFFDVLHRRREEALQVLSHAVHSEEQGKQQILIGMIGELTKILDVSFVENE